MYIHIHVALITDVLFCRECAWRDLACEYPTISIRGQRTHKRKGALPLPDVGGVRKLLPRKARTQNKRKDVLPRTHRRRNVLPDMGGADGTWHMPDSDV